MLSAAPADTAPCDEPRTGHIRDQLQARCEELQSRLMRIEADRRREHGPLPQDFADQATIRENDEVLDRLAETVSAELAQAVHALERFDHGLYGDCERCGEAIDCERLRVLPTTTRCRHCAGVGAAA